MLLLSNHDSTIQFDRPPRPFELIKHLSFALRDSTSQFARPPRPFELIKHLSFALRRRYMPLFWELAGMRAGGGGVTS